MAEKHIGTTLGAAKEPVTSEMESNSTKSDAPNHTDIRLIRDQHGIPLIPQPSSDPMDPLNWKLWIKIMVLAEISLLSFLALLSASLIVGTYPQRGCLD